MFRSTKGASKQRRDCINFEINEIKQCLPLTENVKRRLSQLQIMAICKAYVQKTNCFQNSVHLEDRRDEFRGLDFTEALPGFLMVTNLEGKIIYVSDNVTEYIGHSMVELLTQAESVYDILDSGDHARLTTFMLAAKTSGDVTRCDDVIDCVCLINLGGLFRRNNVMDRRKRMKLHAKLVWGDDKLNLSEPVCVLRFSAKLGTTPNEPAAAPNDTMTFVTRHSLDMKYIDIEQIGEYHMGYKKSDLVGKSWYAFIHPNFTDEAIQKHMELMSSPNDSTKSLVVQMQTENGTIVWAEIVMRLVHNSMNLMNNEGGCFNPQEIMCMNHVMDEWEALETMRNIQIDAMSTAMKDQYSGLELTTGAVPVGMPEITLPIAVIEETLQASAAKSNAQQSSVDHQELLKKLRYKAQEKNRNKKRKPTDCNEESMASFSVMGFETRQPCGNQGSMTPLYNNLQGSMTPPYSDDGLQESVVYVPTPPDFSARSHTPPYSPQNFSFYEEGTLSNRKEETFFDPKPQEKREIRSGADLPVLDHTFVERYLEDMEVVDVLRQSCDVLQGSNAELVSERVANAWPPNSRSNCQLQELTLQQNLRQKNPLIDDVYLGDFAIY